MHSIFDLTNKVALITGGGGLLGPKHAEAILDFGGTVILADHHVDKAKEKAEYLNQKYGAGSAEGIYMDVTSPESITKAIENIDKVDILINNAAKDPKVKARLKRAFEYAEQRKEASKKKTKARMKKKKKTQARNKKK